MSQSPLSPVRELEHLNPEINRIHELAESLLPVYAQIELGETLPNP